MENDEAESEKFGNCIIKKINLPSFFLGTGYYSNINYTTFEDTQNMFKNLEKTIDEQDILEKFFKDSKKTQGICGFYDVPSDLRVDEILYGLMFPMVEEIVDSKNCEDYVEWLGLSCANNLRILHDNNILHGTYFVPKWTNDSEYKRVIHSNAYTGNHVIGEEETWIVDFDLTRYAEGEKKSKFDDEIESLIYLQNPLIYGEFYRNNSLRNSFRERLANKFIQGINHGYNKDIFDIENNLKKDMLKKLTHIKKKMWTLYELPKGLTRARDYIEYVIAKKNLSRKEFQKYIKSENLY
jgi:hypothetical protein